jgi:tripeptide aminopeptidase
MLDRNLTFDEDRALDRLLHFLAIEGITGQEARIGQAVVQVLAELGVPAEHVRFDRVHEKIPLPTQTGNLIVRLPGTRPGAPRLFSTHLDTVPLCAGAVPERRGGRIVSGGNTALGGDNRTGVACLVTLIATLLQRRLPHPPLTVLFTVREESGLWGARFVAAADLDSPSLGFNVDGRSPEAITIGAVGAERFDVEIHGRAAHAGVHPEQGISATAVAALALADVVREGWFGKVVKNGKEGTSNVGSISGPNGRCAGEATNVVTDYALVRGEARSHHSPFVRQIVSAYRDAFRKAAAKVRDHKGKGARIRFRARRDYFPFRLKETSPVVRLACAATVRAGLNPTLRVTNGGLDANWLVRHGIPTITFGAGQHEPHTVQEYVEIPEFLRACRLALALATHP